ncbi:MAG: HepT-like ribonuclease domain-containing protein [Saccharolobus sp.]|nr:DUF86 domain-containing protein [Saccharolobus shibatae]
MISFRNILVHGYVAIKAEVVKKIISERSYSKVLEIALELKRRAKDYWDP